MSVHKAVCFGEIMLRLGAPGHERLLQSPRLEATFGGAEANVAVSLAQFGWDSYYVTRLPANPLGDAAVRALRAEGVRVDHVVRGGARLGLYFTETGAGQRPSSVLYDRAGSAIAALEPGSIPWHDVLHGAAWFHASGITPALGAGPAACTAEALDAARRAGARTSFDLNYRAKLWSPLEAGRVLQPLMSRVDLLVASLDQLGPVLGIGVSNAELGGEGEEIEACRVGAERIARTFGIGLVALTRRLSPSASENAWSAVLFDATTGTLHESARYVLRLVDRIGGGDAFTAGLVHGLATTGDAGRALRFAVAAGALKQTIPGDFNRVSADEVDHLVDGDGTYRVQR